MDLKPFRHEATFVAGEVSLHLVMDFAAIDLIETQTGQSLQLLLDRMASSMPTAIKFIWAMTREKNEDVTIDQIAEIVFSKKYGHAMMATLGDIVRRSFPNVFPAPAKPKPKRR